MSAVASPKVFISYRREETAGHTGRLYDELAERLGAGNVFMDIDLAPGIDFVERITSAVDGCRALLVVIGPRWATTADGDGHTRLDAPDDFVRLEVETALRSPDVTVIPVLVAGARMPQPGQLPESLRPLARRNAIELSDQRWRYDVGRLLDTVGALLGSRPRADAAPRRLGPWQALEGALIAAVVARFMLVWVEGINSAGTTDRGPKIATTIERNTLAWAVVGLVLAAWLTWRRGDPRGVPGAALSGLLLGALGAALGSALYAVVAFGPDPGPELRTLETVSVATLALVGAGQGLALGTAWRPPHALPALATGAAAAVLAQLVLLALGAHVLPTDALRPHDELAAAAQAAVIAAGVLGVLIARDRAPTR